MKHSNKADHLSKMNNRMNKTQLFSLCILQGALLFSGNAFSDSFSKAFEEGTASGNVRLRYESVEQDNALKDASALTLRTRLGFATGDVSGFSGFAEFEDSRVVGGQDEYSPFPPAPNKVYSVIADPETTELDQAYVKYKTDNFSTKLGRQVITLGNHRYVGHVGWRQDRQTFDAISFKFKPIEDLSLDYAYIYKRNRIIAEVADVDSKDLILNATYNLSGTKLSAYGVLLEVEDTGATNDTIGIKVSGAQKVGDAKLLYTAEYATQSADSGVEYDADYIFLELGAAVSGVTAKVGYEVLGSDNGDYGFSTPLATLHKFNGWADQFLNTPTSGLVDTYISLSTKVSGVGLGLTYHDFSTDESGAADDLGSELDIVVKKKFAKKYASGIKYAAYSAGDTGVDTDKLWVWTSMSF